MTVKDFGRASKEDDSYVVNVREHKTFHNYGHTQVVLTSNLCLHSIGKKPGARHRRG